MKKDFYETLGVTKSATQADIKSAYRKMALKEHPDVNKSPDAEEKFKEINEAYEILGNSEKRAAYDNYGHAAFDQSAGAGGGGQDPYENFVHNFNINDIFKNIFNLDDDESYSRGYHYSYQPRQPRFKIYKIQITFLEAANGCEKNIPIDGSNIPIKIPAGVEDGQKFPISSDSVGRIDVLPDKIFSREGNDVYADIHISIKQAILGDIITIPTLQNPLKIRIHAGSQPGTLIQLKGKGIRDINGFSHGYLFIRLNVTIPTSLTSHDRQLLERTDL